MTIVMCQSLRKSGIKLFWSKKNYNEILTNKGNTKLATISTYDFSTIYTTLTHNLIKVKLTQLVEKTVAREKEYF